MTILIVSGCLLFLFLGVAHGWLTLRSTPERGAFTPTDPEVREAIQRPGGLGLAPHLSMPLWRAWIGFNLSHSLGVVVSALVLLVPLVRDADAALADPWWLAMAFVVPPLYLVLSVRYWFETPTRAITIGVLLVGSGVVGSLLT